MDEARRQKKEKADVKKRTKQVASVKRKKERADELVRKVQALQQKTSERAILNANKSKKNPQKIGREGHGSREGTGSIFLAASG